MSLLLLVCAASEQERARLLALGRVFSAPALSEDVVLLRRGRRLRIGSVGMTGLASEDEEGAGELSASLTVLTKDLAVSLMMKSSQT